MIQPSVSGQPDSKLELSRSLKGRHLAMISIGGIIGAGLFVGSSTAILAAGPAVFISYAITGILILLVMRMLGEMATALPHVRSFTEFSRSGLGNGAGFIVGWLYWYFWVLVVPVEAIAGAKILQVWMQSWIPGISLLEIGAGLMTIMTAVNLLSARSYAEFEFWFASIKVAAILVFILIAAAFAFGLTAPSGATFANLVNHGGFAPHTWIAVLAAAPTVFFAMTGAEITTVAAAESAQPGRAIGQMTTTVIWRILIFYVVSVFLIVSVIPWNSVRSGESPFALALDKMHVPWAGLIMNAIVLTAVLSCLNSAFYVSSRVLFVLAERGDAPQFFVRLNKRRVPVVSVLIGAAAGFLGILAATKAPQRVFDFLVSSSGALMVFVYMITVAAHIALRRRREANQDAPPAISMWLFPYLSYAAIACMVIVLVAMARTPAQQQDFQFSCVTLAAAVIAYLIVRRLRQPRLKTLNEELAKNR
jgi:L-asparagine transporter-like permease